MEVNHDLDIVKVTAVALNTRSEVEQFTINLSGVDGGVEMTFEWDKTIVSLPITK